MLNLIFAILSSAGIFVCFKYFEIFKIDILSAIVINYITASLCGLLLAKKHFDFGEIVNQDWLLISILIGIAFIVVFFIIGRSTQNAGILVTTLASKLSFIIPMIFSIVYFGEEMNIKKAFGFALAVLAILLSIYKNSSNKLERKFLLLPILLFLGAGVVDSMVKFAQEKYLSNGGTEHFSTLLFAIAAFSGLTLKAARKNNFSELIKGKILLGGVLLGMVNFGSLYFLIGALNTSNLDSSIIFSFVNIGIVTFSVIFGLLVFKEKLNRLNFVGILLAFIAIFILAY